MGNDVGKWYCLAAYNFLVILWNSNNASGLINVMFSAKGRWQTSIAYLWAPSPHNSAGANVFPLDYFIYKYEDFHTFSWSCSNLRATAEGVAILRNAATAPYNPVVPSIIQASISIVPCY